MWRIYYSDGSVVQGETREEWLGAPSSGVQVVSSTPMLNPVKWSYALESGEIRSVQDRDLWTGDDYYDPFGWGVKEGELLEWEDYQTIWRLACGDHYT